MALMPAAVGLAWLGGAILLLSDARRGLALGLLVAGAGLGAGQWAVNQHEAAVASAVAGALAAALRLRDGEPGWRLVPAGSTPRVVLSLVTLVVLLLVFSSLRANTPLLIASVAVAVLGIARLLTAETRAVALSGAAALALGLAGTGGLVAAITAAVVAVGLTLVPAGVQAARAP